MTRVPASSLKVKTRISPAALNRVAKITTVLGQCVTWRVTISKANQRIDWRTETVTVLKSILLTVQAVVSVL